MYRATLVFGACLALVLMPAAWATAQNLVYDLETYIGNDGPGTGGVIGGTITTDGTLGQLTPANIVSMDPLMQDMNGGTTGIADLNTLVTADNDFLVASLTEIWVPFTTDAGGAQGTSAAKFFGAGTPETRDFIEYINQEGTGDPGRRVQPRFMGGFGQHRLPDPDGILLVGTRIPEPGSAMLLIAGLGLAGTLLGTIRRRRN